MDSPSSSQELRASQTSLHFSDSGSDKENAPANLNYKPYTAPSTDIRHDASSSDNEDEEEDDGNAYERVRRQLMGGLGSKGSVKDPAVREASSLKMPAASSGLSPSRVSAAPNGRIAQRMRSLFGSDSDDELQEGGVSLQSRDDEKATQQSLAAPAFSEDELATPQSGEHKTTARPAKDLSPSQSSPQLSQNSLFLSSAPSNVADSDDEIPQVPSRLQALVARKREERLAKERAAEEARHQSESDDMPEQVRRPAKKARKQPVAAPVASDGPSDEEEGGDEALTQHNRPSRKASKKAIEEMNRETQRMQRNMQLTHQAKTKTSFSTTDLFKKFNFRQPKVQDQAAYPTGQGQPASASASSDVEQAVVVDTPPSSPPSLTDEASKPTTGVIRPASLSEPAADSDSDGPSLQQAFQAARKQSVPEPQHSKAKISVREFMKRAGKQRTVKPNDDDLLLIKPKFTGGIAVLDRAPAVKPRESHAVHALHTLAHMNEHDVKPRKGTRKSMAPSELSAHLRQLARKQAMAERDEKIQALKDKGIYVQTAEERERDQIQLENMLDKARQEAQELAQREKDAAKREGREVENDFPDSDEDEDYVASADEENIQLSGSEDEGSHADNEDSDDDGETSDNNELDGQAAQNPLLDDAASESGVDEEAEVQAATNIQVIQDEDPAEGITHATPARPTVVRRNRKTLIDSDDEEDVPSNAAIVNTPTQGRPTPKTPKSALAAAFGFGQAQEAGLGLSQMFAGTMAESQDDENLQHAAVDSQQDSLAFLRGLAPSSMPNFGGVDSPIMARESQDIIVQNSQAGETQFEATAIQGPGLDDVHFETPMQMPYPETQVMASQMPDATQDEGFQTAFSPIRPLGGAPNPSNTTVDTVLLGSPSLTASPILKRKGRLQRRGHDAQDGLEDAANVDEDPTIEISDNVFEVMRKAAATKPAGEAEFDRKKSDAKGMVDEQAEESEDEYAGLGGASDDESTGELDAETKAALIDDTTKEKLNERQVAAFFADKERADDEKRVEKLFKDIANGGLRRKRGADLELWDSDDEDEAAKRKRAAKQREFAKMRRALLADEKLGKIAENPKQAAFLQAIEDREGEDEVFFLDAPEELPEEESQPQVAEDEPEDGVPAEVSGSLKRKRTENLDEDDSQEQTTRPSEVPAPMTRRTGRFTRPTTLQDIRATLSELIGEPTPSQHLSDDDKENEQMQEDGAEEEAILDSQPLEHSVPRSASPAGLEINNETLAARRHPRRTPASTVRTAVIDRIAMKRSRSSSLAAKAASSVAASRQAFFSASVVGAGSFKVPSLLRRATTNASNTSDTSHSDTLGALSVNAGGMGKEVIKVGGSKKSSVNYYVREKERRAKVEEVERTRNEGRKRIGQRRRKEVGVGLGGRVGGGGFED